MWTCIRDRVMLIRYGMPNTSPNPTQPGALPEARAQEHAAHHRLQQGMTASRGVELGRRRQQGLGLYRRGGGVAERGAGGPFWATGRSVGYALID